MTQPNPSAKSIQIKKHLCNSYPDLKGLFNKAETLECLKLSEQCIPSAIVQIIIEQMLSAKAANTIYGRVKTLATEKSVADWSLQFEEYRSCGLSKTKANAILSFAAYYKSNTNEVENWHQLESEQLITEITKHKGIGRWTGTIMALFHFGREDIFPDSDSSLQKVNEIIYDQYQVKIDTSLAKPYRSYLATYFWHFLDKGLLSDKIEQQDS